ncbi:hypothetical protein CJ739_2717 [Mariniflexile rhizosphaerae]|uniref:hypothetical protein n=1 Tax=unclassified Mariniflexile TaxID=2643887 RepID=UPI000CAC66B1|nr:hypothetical protein [Mariniflexile sp. TRM1-10]AXP81784.1 hypothetical protein CJ739_2717 [Mariniflexile sp. TRM1-10]PLB20834.1 MAG: hypothetical protein TRG1_402 [Flavobacteriaceae bacterium FS1-H7996/R]
MKTHHINTPFIVTKDISNGNGFLLPHVLYDKIKTVATYPVKEFYLQDIPEIGDFKFKMYKNAFLNDKLTIQAQLVKQNKEGYLVNITVTKAKSTTNYQERICSALFDFPVEKRYNTNRTAC